MIALVLALPLLMLAAFFALDALEDWLFPPPPNLPKAQALGRHARPRTLTTTTGHHPRELGVATSRQDGRRRSPRAGQ